MNLNPFTHAKRFTKPYSKALSVKYRDFRARTDSRAPRWVKRALDYFDLYFVDHHVFQKLQQLQILPSDLCSDEEFVRRATLDVIGLLPTAAETDKFLTDKDPQKRSKLVDTLLERPEFAEFWALKWGDLLRIRNAKVSNAGVQHLDTIADVSFENWRRILAIHLDGGFLTARACLRRMISQGRGGAILLMGSVHSKEASVQKGPYVVAKHGLLGLARVRAGMTNQYAAGA